MHMQNGPTDRRPLTMGMRIIKKAKISSQKLYNEGWQQLANNQFRLSKQLYKTVSNVCELYKFWNFVISKEQTTYSCSGVVN